MCQVAELTKAEEELRREAAASSQVLKEENARLTAESATLAESYDTLLAQRQQDRQNFEQQVRLGDAGKRHRTGDATRDSGTCDVLARLLQAN